MKKSQLKMILATLTMFSTTTYAGVLQLKGFVAAGGGCSVNDTSGYITENDDMAIEFFNFQVDTNANQAEVSRFCNFEASVDVPEGYQLAVKALIVEGETTIPAGGSATLKSSYYMTGYEGWATPWEINSGDQLANGATAFPVGFSSFSIKKSPKQMYFSACGEDVVFVGTLETIARRGGNNGGQASMVITDAIGDNRKRIAWDWQLQRCERLPSYQSHYQGSNGHQVSARIEFEGQNGTYTLSNGTVGQLRNVQRVGNHLRGFWSINNQDGWFDFELTTDLQSFSGHWGYGEQYTNPQGFWVGVSSF